MKYLELFRQNFYVIYRNFYILGVYDKQTLKPIVKSGVLTADGYKQITGVEYVA